MSTSDRLSEKLKAAVDAVEAAGVPDDLRKLAFTRALDEVLGTPQPRPSAGLAPEPSGARVGSSDTDTEPSGTRVAQVAKALHVSGEELEKVLEIGDTEVHVRLPRSKLAKTKAAAMVQVARLVASGRQAAGIDDKSTSVEAVRQACEDRGVYDQKNFATNVAKAEEYGFALRGSKRKRQIHGNAHAFEQTGELIKELAAVE